MRNSVTILVLLLIALFALVLPSAASASDVEDNTGWDIPFIGYGRGDWSAHVGTQFWSDKWLFRNLQFRADVDIVPGVRAHTVIRSDREYETLEGFHPRFDEAYIEGLAFHRDSEGTFSGNLKIGTTRYLRFPYPDRIAVFDQVPGVGDLIYGGETGYSGYLLTLDYQHKTGFGLHYTGIKWDFAREGDANTIESYLSYKKKISDWEFEARAGALQVRPEPLGRNESGFNVFVGKQIGDYNVGVLYENLNNQPEYTGLQVTFAETDITRFLGEVAFDYDRDPQGIALHLPLAHGKIGNVLSHEPDGGVLVGEVKAERIRTYWQNGQVRNYYEHRLESWGETGSDGLMVVCEECPWTLDKEALVSPNTDVFTWDGLKKWEEERQGPAQLTQKVTYKYYKAGKDIIKKAAASDQISFLQDSPAQDPAPIVTAFIAFSKAEYVGMHSFRTKDGKRHQGWLKRTEGENAVFTPGGTMADTSSEIMVPTASIEPGLISYYNETTNKWERFDPASDCIE